MSNVDIPHADPDGVIYYRFRDRPAAHTAMDARNRYVESAFRLDGQWELREKHAHITNQRRNSEWRARYEKIAKRREEP